jgi:3-methylcrotonyl-CoA carboxylase alpha subunit/geranyl-CoA carboxylase alpha subunit
MLGKLIAHAATREQAITQLTAALQRTVVLGLPTNRGLLVECLRHPQFRDGGAAIPFLAEQGDALRTSLADSERSLTYLIHAAVWAANASGGALALCVPFERPMRLRHRGQFSESRILEQAPDMLRIACSGQTGTLQVQATPGGWRLVLDGATHFARAARLPSGDWHLQIADTDLMLTDVSHEPRRNGSANMAIELKAPFSGRVVALRAAAGARVAAGETLLVIESMKLEHAITAPRAARLAGVAVALNQQVSAQQLLVRFEAEAA